ncbi:hypothetical protein EDB85DRAFT_1899556 [Lactarius pseudohatsudake]|nr:hypothetical protein EDB85DRAFT_1899556 [Lactarius pseudohatsudake]
MPRVHPVLQAISKEWKAAKGDNRVPSWDGITLEYVAQLCKKTEEIYPDWHVSLMSVNLREYLVGIEPSKMWWLEEEEDDNNDADVVMLNAPPPPSKSQSSLAPPKSTITTRAKGKAPAIPKPALPPAPQPRPCAKKRRADDSPDAAIIKSDDTAPRKSGRPQVEVVITSPPHQGKRRRDNSPAVATGADRCGPCIDREEEECISQPTGKCLTTACTYCAKNRKMCNPPAAWASADARSVSSARTRTPSAAVDAQIEALTQQVQDMSLELSEVKKTLDISLEEIRRGREESREEARRGREEFRAARLHMHNTSLMVTALLAKQGIVSASNPGIGQPPPSLSQSRSPANPPTTSPGIPLSTLKISDARSAASSRTSSATSERRRAMELPSASVAGSLASRRASPSGPLPGASATASRPASPSGPLPGASATASRQASPSGPLPAPPEGTGSSRKSSPGQQEPHFKWSCTLDTLRGEDRYETTECKENRKTEYCRNRDLASPPNQTWAIHLDIAFRDVTLFPCAVERVIPSHTSKGKHVSSSSMTSKSDRHISTTRKHVRTSDLHPLHSPDMFSDPVDDSDTQSFDEDDMYGSDPNAETFPLEPGPKVQEVSNNEYCDTDLISDAQEWNKEIRHLCLMVEALCEVEGINVSEITSGTHRDILDHASEMSWELEIPDDS